MKTLNFKIHSTKHIRLTRKVVSDMFDECNALYFENKIERPVKFETWTPGKKILGMVRPYWIPKNKDYGAIFHISRRYQWTNENLRHVVVHEMIHLAIGDYKQPLSFIQRLPLIGRFFIVQHNDEFITKMNEINEKYGLQISIRFPAMKKEFIH